MVRVVGMDPGTRSLDLCGMEDGRVFLDISIPSTAVDEDPGPVIDCLKEVSPLDAVAAPSGYGLPFIPLSKIGHKEYFLAFLVRPDDVEVSVLKGLPRLVERMREEGFNGFMTPGVVHLPTVPEWRKINRIDMGTADKLCCAVLAVYDQSRRLGIPYSETSFILVEMGFGFNAAIAVEKGQVVDGVGGTTGGLGFLAMGSMDGELAYQLGRFSKDLIFQGGAAYVAGDGGLTPESLAEKADEDARKRVALEAFVESVLKTVSALKVSVQDPLEILVSGRLSRVEGIYQKVLERLSRLGQVRKVSRFAEVSKEAAQGAALIADGLAGGRFSDLLEATGIRGASGTALDHLYLPVADSLRRSFGI
ncbi:MAG: DUF1464 family protein [Candidatus Bathyarchaeia archaeon]